MEFWSCAEHVTNKQWGGAPHIDDDPRAPTHPPTQPPPCDIPSGCCFFTGPWIVTRSSLRMLRRVAAFCQPLRPVLLLVSFLQSRSPVVGVLGLPPPNTHNERDKQGTDQGGLSV